MVKWQELKRDVIKSLTENGMKDAATEANLLFELAVGERALGKKDFLLTEEQAKVLQTALQKRISGYPMQYLLGEWAFLDFSVKVGPGVLVPRQDTEVVCEQAISLGSLMQALPAVILDLCSGSGIIALAIKKAFPLARVTAVEKEEEAFFYLRQNIKNTGIIAEQADIFTYQKELEKETVDLIISNPPYLTEDEMQHLQREVSFEPANALAGGKDGYLFYKHIIAEYFFALKKGGALVLEIGSSQKSNVILLCEKAGFSTVGCVQDYSGNDRCVWAVKE